MNEELTPIIEDVETSDIDSSDESLVDELTADSSESEVDSSEKLETVPEGSTGTGQASNQVGDNELTIVDFLELDFVEDLQKFYKHYLVETPEGFIQVFQSLTYGELLISFLLLMLIVLYVMKWIYEILRY